MTFPVIHVDQVEGLTDEERKIVKLTINTRNGQLRVSKPKIKYEIYTHAKNGRKYRDAIDLTGEAAYVWRMLAYYLSSSHPHCCMPMSAPFDLPGRVDVPDYMEKNRELQKRMDNLVDRVLDTIPKEHWRGVRRWGNALGYSV